MLNVTSTEFPSRGQIQKNYQDTIIEQAQKINLDKVDFSNEEQFKPRQQVIEKQKIYFWIRVYLHDEIEIEPNTDVFLTYTLSGEKLETKFICYAKKGLDKDRDPNIINYNPDDDRKVICLMVDTGRIDKHSQDIPFIRTLFRTSRHYQPQILKLSEISITDSSGREFDYFDIDF